MVPLRSNPLHSAPGDSLTEDADCNFQLSRVDCVLKEPRQVYNVVFVPAHFTR
jgi:hypothetical protein